MSDTAEAATEIVAEVADEVAEQATHVADISRGLAGRDLGLVLGGLIVGAAASAVATYILTRRKLEDEYSKRAADEVAEVVEHYNNKIAAHENTVERPELEEIIRERGYDPGNTQPPMAVEAPAAVVDAVRDDENPEDEAVLVDDPEPVARNVFEDNPPPQDIWDWHKERAKRSPLEPYVIHVDEREGEGVYSSVTYTYYAGDDVVCNERDEILDVSDRERILGETNLDRFGHGSNDSNVVYIRNDQLEMDIEVVKSPNSYEQEVAGFEPEIRHAHSRRGRTQFDDE